MSLEIKRLIDRQIHTITLTEEELEQAYRIKERHYLEEDFANVLADTAQNPDTRFHSGHLEEFPELTDWLCECFDHFYDANISYNDLMELTVNHLHHACLTPEFFTRLALKAPAFCKGLEKQRTAPAITAALTLLWQMSGVSAGKPCPPCLPCTYMEAAPATKVQKKHSALQQNICMANGTSLNFSIRKKGRRRSDEKAGEDKRANPCHHSEGRK